MNPITPRIYLLLMLGVLPLAAQTGVNDDGKLAPGNVPTIAPAPQPGAAIIQPGINGAATPELPAAPVPVVKIVTLTVEPGTLREGILYKAEMLTHITLSGPATKEFIVHITTTDAVKISATDIRILKGQSSGAGGINVTWKNIKHDGAMVFSAYDEDNPEIVLHARMYYRKKAL